MDVSAKAGFSVIAIPIQIQSLTSDSPAGIGPYGQTNIDVVLSGTLPGVPVTLQAVSQCAATGKATLLPALLTTSIGSGSFVLKDNQCGVNSNNDTVTISVVGSTESKSIQIPIGKPAASSLAYVSASPSVIYLKGSGFAESSTVTFQVRDSSGNPLPNVPVTLSLVNATGGVTLEGAGIPRNSDSNGQVSGRVVAGTVPTPVRVRAELSSNTSVNTVSSGLSIAVGLPAQQNFSLAQRTINIEGWNYDGTTNSYTIIASDRLGNPVPDDTAINFVTEGGGQIASQAFTKSVQGLSSATATFQSSEPRPADGRITVLAYALGEESFLDLNGNNVWDGGSSAEPFQDLGDLFISRRFVTTYDSAVDQTISFANSTENCVLNTNPCCRATPRSRPLVRAATRHWVETLCAVRRKPSCRPRRLRSTSSVAASAIRWA
ncbi:Ig-like domain-containing protein [Ideonella paludis]|uniref:Ig-like domain-containing protein n=1 Tax=Ideonella paludis TaxID=1233411 RepID=UPI003638D501